MRPIPILSSALVCAALSTTVVAGATLAVANKADATLSLLDLVDGEVVATLPTGNGPHEVGVSPDGRLALVANYGGGTTPGSTLTLVDVAGASVVRTIELGEFRRPHGVVWLDASRALVTAEDQRALLEVDVEHGRVERAIATGQAVSHMVVATADGTRAFVANIGSGSVTAIDLEKGTKIADIATGEGAEGIALARGGRELWVTNREADTLSVLDAASLAKIVDIPSPGFPIRSRATSRGEILVTHARGGHLAIFAAESRSEAGRIQFDLAALGAEGRLFGDRFGASSVPIGVVVSDDGALAYVAHANADVVTEIDLGAKRVVRTLRAGKEPDGMAWSSIDVAPEARSTPGD